MKAIILAAGMGTRLKEETKNKPKGMIQFLEKTLLEWQIASLRAAGLDEIVVVAGYKEECINLEGITKIVNPRYDCTNMVESLMCAREHLIDGVIISYSDIVYDSMLVTALLENNDDVAVMGDVDWFPYWKRRMPTTWQSDIESFHASKKGVITDLGKPMSSIDNVTHRYVGLVKFSHDGAKRLLSLYKERKELKLPWSQSGNTFEQGYLTDVLNELVLTGSSVALVESVNGWLEFDEPCDFQFAQSLAKKRMLGLQGTFGLLDELVAIKSKLDCSPASINRASLKSSEDRVTHILNMLPEDCQKDRLLDEIFKEDWENYNLRGWNGVNTRNLLLNLVKKMLEGQFDDGAQKLFRKMQETFAMQKMLFAMYSDSSLTRGAGSIYQYDCYALFSILLSLEFSVSKNLDQLNMLYVINTFLLHCLDEEQVHYNTYIEMALRFELTHINDDCIF